MTDNTFTTNVIDAQSRTKTVVRISFTTDQVIGAGYTKHLMVPFHAELTFVYRKTTAPGGWTEHTWACSDAELTGHRVLKPGPDGSLRVGVAEHVARLWARDGFDDIATMPDTPAFLADLIQQARPSGEVSTLSV